MNIKVTHESTYYRATAAQSELAALVGDIHCQVCIVGGGFAGLATALGLLEKGVKDVVLIEAEQIGFGASGRNGGFVFGGFSLDNADLIAQLGKPKARQLYQLTLDAVELIRQRIARYHIDCDACYDGVLLANWFDDPSILERQREFMRREFDVEWRSLSREETREKLRSQRYFGALHESNAFHFHPLKYAQGVARVIAEKGGQIFERTRAIDIIADRAEKRVITAHGVIHAQQVVMTCGGYINRVYPALARAVLPIATYVMATEPLHDKLATAMNSGAAVYDTRFAFDYYRPLPDSRILWGGRISILDRTPAQVAQLLYRDLLKVYPQLHGSQVDFAWSGMMSYARHKMPQIGCLPNGIWYAMGFGGHGVGPTTLAGQCVAQAIADGKSLPSGFERFGLPPTYGWLGLLAAQATYWYYECRDWLKE